MEGVASTSKVSTEIVENNPKQTKSKPGGTFACSFCSLNEHFHYKGTKPPFARQLVYLEDCYIMIDPFSPLNEGEALVLGSDCNFCKKAVCLDCSIFFKKRFCKTCALEHIEELPTKLHKKVKELTKDEDVN